MEAKRASALSLFNSAALAALVVGGALYSVASDPDQAGSASGGTLGTTEQPPVGVASEDEPQRARLEAEVRALKARVATLEQAQGGAPAKSEGDELASVAEAASATTPSATPAASGAQRAPDALVRRSQVRSLFRAELRRHEQAQAKARAEAAAKATKPKKTLREVADAIGLEPHQEETVRTHYRELEAQSMRVFFGLAEDADLRQLDAQLERAKHDPALKETLRERISVNWTRNQKEFWVLFVKLDAKLRKVLPKDKLAKLYRYDVQLADKRFPDIQEMFFQREEK